MIAFVDDSNESKILLSCLYAHKCKFQKVENNPYIEITGVLAMPTLFTDDGDYLNYKDSLKYINKEC